MRALVTGADGFIGSHLVDHLVESGYAVRAVVRPGTDAGTSRPGVEIFAGDTGDAAAMREAAAGCDHVYHLAARTGRRGGTLHDYETANVGATDRVGRAALEAGAVRVVHASSAGVHGGVRGTVDETRPVRPNTPYRETKARAEAVMRGHHERDGLPAVVVRFTSVIGPGALSWLGLYRAVAAGGPRIIGTGANRVPLTPVQDLVRGLRLCAEAPGIDGQTLLLGGVDSITLASFLHAIAEALGVPFRARHTPAAPFRAYGALADAAYRTTGARLPRAHRYELFLSDRSLDLGRARDRIGFVPEVPLRRAIRETAAWYRHTGRL